MLERRRSEYYIKSLEEAEALERFVRALRRVRNLGRPHGNVEAHETIEQLLTAMDSIHVQNLILFVAHRAELAALEHGG